eukprot:343660-Chlamydomonas_euryale.AAC.8
MGCSKVICHVKEHGSVEPPHGVFFFLRPPCAAGTWPGGAHMQRRTGWCTHAGEDRVLGEGRTGCNGGHTDAQLLLASCVAAAWCLPAAWCGTTAGRRLHGCCMAGACQLHGVAPQLVGGCMAVAWQGHGSGMPAVSGLPGGQVGSCVLECLVTACWLHRKSTAGVYCIMGAFQKHGGLMTRACWVHSSSMVGA